MIVAIVQARMSSRRLPGKVLMELAGRPTLDWVLDSAERAKRVDRLVVATSVEPSDDPIEAYSGARGVECHRGPLDDVAGRFLEVVDRLEPRAFVRITADSPLLDHRVIDDVVSAYQADPADVVTTVFPRTVPSGQSVELVTSEAFRRAYPLMDPTEREHVTLHFYRHPDAWRIAGVEPQDAPAQIAVSLDTPEDAERIEALLRSEAEADA
jgi:spore coat polysaccharide biosynthesis protein SpsF